MVEESKKVLERHPILFECLKYMTIILVEIENTLDYVYNKKKIILLIYFLGYIKNHLMKTI